MKSRKAAPRSYGRSFNSFRLQELENRLTPSSTLPKNILLDLGDVYSTANYSTSIHRYTDRIALGLDVSTASATLAKLTAPTGILAGFQVVQTLDSGIKVLATPALAGDSADVRYVDLAARIDSLAGETGVRWSAPVFHDVATQNGWMVATNELIVSLRQGVSPDQFFVGDGRFVSWRPLSGTNDQFVASTASYGAATIEFANQLGNDSRLAWRNPIIIRAGLAFSLRTTHSWRATNGTSITRAKRAAPSMPTRTSSKRGT